jgi:hypothetical protein
LLPQRGKYRWTGGCRRWAEVWKQSEEKKVSGEKKEDVLVANFFCLIID